MTLREQNRASYLRLKEDPTKLAALQAKRREAWLIRKANPEALAAHRAHAKAWNAEQRKSPATWLRITLTMAKSRAKKRGIPFDITVADVVVPTHCPITLQPLAYGCSNRDRSGPSLDRVNPALGYVKGNVRVISLMANVIKQDCTSPEIFDRLAAYLREC